MIFCYRNTVLVSFLLCVQTASPTTRKVKKFGAPQKQPASKQPPGISPGCKPAMNHQNSNPAASKKQYVTAFASLCDMMIICFVLGLATTTIFVRPVK